MPAPQRVSSRDVVTLSVYLLCLLSLWGVVADGNLHREFIVNHDQNYAPGWWQAQLAAFHRELALGAVILCGMMSAIAPEAPFKRRFAGYAAIVTVISVLMNIVIF